MRSGIGPYSFGYTSIWIRQTAKPFEALWKKAQQTFVAAVLYHSNMIGDCEAFVAVPDKRVKEIAGRLADSVPEKLDAEEKVVYEFMLIRKKIDDLLTWMKHRLQGQTYFNDALMSTLRIAKECLDKAVDKHRQEEELKLMREAELETVEFNRLFKEQKAIEEAKSEQEKKEREQKMAAEE